MITNSFFRTFCLLVASLVCVLGRAEQRAVPESARNLPVVKNVDVVIVGGSTGAVSAAVAASKAGAKVFLAAPRPYLGEDLCASLRLWLESGETPGSELGSILFKEGTLARPLHIKDTLSQALQKANVDFLFSCYATDLIRGADGAPCGVVIANRAGRQAVLAKVIIDATDRATLARESGAEFHPFPGGDQTVRRVVIGGSAPEKTGLTSRKIESSFKTKSAAKKDAKDAKEAKEETAWEITEYTLQVAMKDASWPCWAAAEQQARDWTYQPGQMFASELLIQVPPDPVKSKKSGQGEWTNAAALDLDAFRPAALPRYYLLSGCAELPRAQAEKLLRPLALIDMGTRIGEAAAQEAKALPAPASPRVKGEAVAAVGDVREILNGLRPVDEGLPTIPQDPRALPVLGTYDVVVIGGGTSGAGAGIGAARNGAKTLVVEYLHGMGGVGTYGAIASYWHGYRRGFTKEVQDGKGKWPIEEKAEWWRSHLRKAGGDLWIWSTGCGAYVDGNTVKGAVVATPFGRGVVLAKTVIDATGNSDIAAAAGAACIYTDGTDLAVQGTGLPPRNLGASYLNTDFTFTDDTDMVDIWHLFVNTTTEYARQGSNFDVGQLIDSRERRRVVGDYTLNIIDVMNNRTYPDTINISSTNFDTHGYTVDVMFAMNHPSSKLEIKSYTPYRCLLPKGFEGILVTGLGTSAHRDAVPVIRMQACLQNQGYAAGSAAAMAAKQSVLVRNVDIKTLQKHLVTIGNIPESVLGDVDSFPLPKEALQEAVESAKQNYTNVAALLSSPAQSIPLLKQAYADASGADKLAYAHILGLMGDATGVQTLIETVEASPWDKGWNFTGMGQFGACMSRLDSYVLALGHAKDPRAVPALLQKIKDLNQKQAFSHHRAIALAMEKLADPKGAEALADLLTREKLTGNHIHKLEPSRDRAERAESLREIMLARALVRCGDKDGLGKKILANYATDLRGHFARHAAGVLKEVREKK